MDKSVPFIIIFEDGRLYKAKQLSALDLQASEDGILQIVDVVNLTVHVPGEEDEWEDIEEWTYG